MLESTKNADKEGILKCLHGVEEHHIKTIDLAIGTNKEASAFRDRFVRQYGHGAWEEFQDENKENQGFTLGLADEISISIDDSKLENTRGETTYFFPHAMRPAIIVDTGSGYLVDADSMFGSKSEGKGYQKTISEMQILIEEFSLVIGAPGLAADDIDYEMNRTMIERLLGPSAAPFKRFDIRAKIAEVEQQH